MQGGLARLATCTALCVAAGLFGVARAEAAPISIGSLDSTYTQSFDGLATTGTSATVPDGWVFAESGTNANSTYTAGAGSGNAGDTYSFGSAGSTDRAFGGLQSGSLIPTVGAAFSNDTGQTVTSLDVAYTGEQWRLGTAGRADRLDFQYSTDATSLTTGTWTDVDTLDFSSPVTSGSTGALDGNAAADRTAVAGTVAGLSLPAGQSVWIRWSDFNASGSDDGLAVDGFSLTARASANLPVVAQCGSGVSATQGTAASTTVTATDGDGRVSNLDIASVSPATAGITRTAFSPALVQGGQASATIGVDASTPAGTYTVTVQATNDDPTPQTATCSFQVTVAAVLPIGTVQGSVTDTTDGATFQSPYAGQTVTVQGVITELTLDNGTDHGFFFQSAPDTADGDPTTSDGIFVYMGGHTDLIGGYAPVVGDEIVLKGKVSEYFDQTELGSASLVQPVDHGVTIEPFAADPPADSADAARYWERREGMLGSLAAGSIVDSPRHFYSSSNDTEFYAISPDSPVSGRSDPYARRVFRDAHPLDDQPGAFDNGNGYRILVTDEGVKGAAGDPNAQLPAVHTFQTVSTADAGGVYYDFGTYSLSVAQQPQLANGPDPSLNDPPASFDRTRAYSIANFNLENLYDYRDDPFDGCDFVGNPGCPGVSPPFDYVPASDAEYQTRLAAIANQIVADLHGPDVIAVAEAEDQDICSVQSWQLVCGTTNDADGKPDTLEELTVRIHALGGPDYTAVNDRDGADARGIVSGFLIRTDRTELIPATAGGAVLGSAPTVQYRGAPLPYDTDVSNPKALNAVLPADVDTSTGTDGSNVFTRAAQVAHLRIWRTGVGQSTFTDVWIVANHFTSSPDQEVGQRREQAAYNAAIVKAIQGEEPDAKVMVAGDLNVYPRPDDPFPPPNTSDQLAPLYDAGLSDLYDAVLKDDAAAAYSYDYQGQAQDLDHEFVTKALDDDLVTVNEAHINADWTEGASLAQNRGTSDHDPMVSRWSALPTVLSLEALVTWEQDQGAFRRPATAKRLLAELRAAQTLVARGKPKLAAAPVLVFVADLKTVGRLDVTAAARTTLGDEGALLARTLAG